MEGAAIGSGRRPLFSRHPDAHMPVFKPKDPDLADLVGKTVYLPRAWWREIKAMAKAYGYKRNEGLIELHRFARDAGGPRNLPEEAWPEVKDLKPSTVYLPRTWWKEMDDDAGPTESRNDVFLRRTWFGLKEARAQVASEKKARK